MRFMGTPEFGQALPNLWRLPGLSDQAQGRSPGKRPRSDVVQRVLERHLRWVWLDQKGRLGNIARPSKVMLHYVPMTAQAQVPRRAFVDVRGSAVSSARASIRDSSDP